MQYEHYKKSNKPCKKNTNNSHLITVTIVIVLLIFVGYFLYTYVCESSNKSQIINNGSGDIIPIPVSQVANLEKNLADLYGGGLTYSPDSDVPRILGFN